MRAAILVPVIALTLPRVARAQEPPPPDIPCDPLGEFGCVYAPGPGNTELRTVLEPGEWQALPIGPGHFAGATGLGGGTLSDGAGLVLGGGSSLESVYELDGLDVSGLYYGGPWDASPVPLPMLGGMIVRRGGMGAALRGGPAGVVSLESARGGGKLQGGFDIFYGPMADGTFTPIGAPPQIAWSESGGIIQGHVGFVGAKSRWNTRWFAGLGFHDDYGHTTRTFNRAVDADDDGDPDVDAEGNPVWAPVETLELENNGSSLPTMLRIDMDPDSSQHLGVTGFLDWSRATYYPHNVGEPAALARHSTELTTDLAGSWRATYGDTELTVQAGWHRHHRKSRSPYAERNQLPGGDVRLGDFWRDYESQDVQDACADGGAGDLEPLIVNCPVSFYWAGGVGQITDDPASRASAQAGARHYLDLYGEHLLQGGVDLDQASYVNHFEYSGGYRVDFLAEGRHVHLGEGPDLCDGMPCQWLDAADLRTVTRTGGAFLADDWSPIDDVTVSVGGRYEAQDIEGVGTVSDLVPRLGVAWDPLGRGRSRLFAATGAYLGRMPLSFSDRAFSGLDSYSRTIDPDTQQVVDESTFAFQRIPVADGVGPLRVNEALAGAEVALAGELRAGVSYLRRELGRILEDADGRITNPFGRRDYDELAFEVRSNPERQLGLRATYTFSRLRGSWQGFIDDNRVAYGAGLLATFDAPDMATNSDGPLPSERTHTLDVGLSYRQPIRSRNLIVGLRAVAVSGAPVSVLGTHPTQGFADVYILPRGSYGRTPMATYMALRMQYESRYGFTFFADALNLFNHQEAARYDSVYTTDDVGPIVGGRPDDLPFLKRLSLLGEETADPARRNPSFGRTDGHYGPWSIWLGVRVGY